jgi:hypothetical protein
MILAGKDIFLLKLTTEDFCKNYLMKNYCVPFNKESWSWYNVAKVTGETWLKIFCIPNNSKHVIVKNANNYSLLKITPNMTLQDIHISTRNKIKNNVVLTYPDSKYKIIIFDKNYDYNFYYDKKSGPHIIGDLQTLPSSEPIRTFKPISSKIPLYESGFIIEVARKGLWKKLF